MKRKVGQVVIPSPVVSLNLMVSNHKFDMHEQDSRAKQKSNRLEKCPATCRLRNPFVLRPQPKSERLGKRPAMCPPISKSPFLFVSPHVGSGK